MTATFSTEAKKVAFYKEKQFFDREDINYRHLTGNQLLDVEAFNTYKIMDQNHFKINFYNSIFC